MVDSNTSNKRKNTLYLVACIFAIIGGVGLLINNTVGSSSSNSIRQNDDSSTSPNVPFNPNPESPPYSPENPELEPLTFNDPDSKLITEFIGADLKIRRFNIFVPGSYFRSSEPVPLVFVWHALTSTPGFVQRQFEMDEIAERENFIIVYPDGLGNAFDIFRVDPELNYDLIFTQEMLDFMKTNYRIKESSVYSTGLSNGGLMSTLLGCVFADQFAGVAPVAATFAAEVIDKCDPNAVVPFIQFHGTRDSIFPINGSPAFSSVDDTIEFWAARNGQNIPATVTEIEDGLFFYDFQPDSIVQHYRYQGANHANIVRLVDSQVIIDFFKAVSDF